MFLFFLVYVNKHCLVGFGDVLCYVLSAVDDIPVNASSTGYL